MRPISQKISQKKSQKKSAPNSRSVGHIRIISGEYRGRKLPVLDADGLRPSTDRTKETLFNWLQGDIRDAVVIDAFAGSGSLTFEALSRGAAHVSSCELNAAAYEQLLGNRATLGITSHCDILHRNVLSLAADDLQLPRPADIVLLDPPFGQDLLSKTVSHLLALGVTHADTLWYCETEPEVPLNCDKWVLTPYKVHETTGFRYGLYYLD
jgi:16S rRNA (guanine966-N2)-methyltransferase